MSGSLSEEEIRRKDQLLVAEAADAKSGAMRQDGIFQGLKAWDAGLVQVSNRN